MNRTTYTDAAYGNLYRRFGRGWEVFWSHRHPRHTGSWQRLTRDESRVIEQRLQNGAYTEVENHSND